MDEPGSQSEFSLIDVTRVPLAQLRLLDDAVFDESVGRIVRMCDSIGDRRWDSPQRILS
jgi:FXSXX-COOH protein